MLQVLAAQRKLIYGRDIYVMTYEGETGILASALHVLRTAYTRCEDLEHTFIDIIIIVYKK